MSQDSPRAIRLVFFRESSEVNKENPAAGCCPLDVSLSWDVLHYPQTALNLPVPLQGYPAAPTVQVTNPKGV